MEEVSWSQRGNAVELFVPSGYANTVSHRFTRHQEKTGFSLPPKGDRAKIDLANSQTPLQIIAGWLRWRSPGVTTQHPLGKVANGLLDDNGHASSDTINWAILKLIHCSNFSEIQLQQKGYAP